MKSKKVKANKDKVSRMISKVEKEYLQALNDLDRVIALNSMESIMESEIEVWAKFAIDNSEGVEAEDAKLMEAVSEEVAALQSVIKLIDEQRVVILKSARALFIARKNSHIKVPYVKHISESI